MDPPERKSNRNMDQRVPFHLDEMPGIHATRYNNLDVAPYVGFVLYSIATLSRSV